MGNPVLHGLTSEFAHGRAFSEVVPLDSPVAGAGFTYTVGGAYWERIAALMFRLVSDGNAANRSVLLSVLDGGGIPLFAVGAQNVQIASLTRDYVYLPQFNSAVGPVNAVYTAPFPSFFLQPAFSVVVSITSVQATDQVSRIRLVRERFDTGPQGYPLGLVDEDALLSEYETVGN